MGQKHYELWPNIPTGAYIPTYVFMFHEVL